MNDDARNPAFARKLKQLMEARELPQSALAAKIWGRYVNSEGIDVAKGREVISMWCSGHRSPTKKQLETLAQILGAKVTDLE